jgi:hypothetical protein
VFCAWTRLAHGELLFLIEIREPERELLGGLFADPRKRLITENDEALRFKTFELRKKGSPQVFKVRVVEKPELRLLVACRDAAIPEVDGDPPQIFWTNLSHRLKPFYKIQMEFLPLFDALRVSLKHILIALSKAKSMPVDECVFYGFRIGVLEL